MRLQAKTPIVLRGKVLGGEKPLVCIPLVASDEQGFKHEVEKIVKLSPDIIEWRVDYYDGACDIERVKKALEFLRANAGEIPIIFTFRSHLEGGFKQVEDSVRYDIVKQVIATGKIDVVDIELISGEANIRDIKDSAQKNGVTLILSYHNFKETPSVDFLLDKIRQQVLSGADIAKIAVMPKNEEDVLNLLIATLRARMEMPAPPIITMSMGGLGVITRVAGWLFGSDLTFAVGDKASAPGQIPISELRLGMQILERSAIKK